MRSKDDTVRDNEVRTGRRRSRLSPKKSGSARRSISEPFLAALGAAFIAVYFAGLLIAAPDDASAPADEFGATPVFAEVRYEDGNGTENDEESGMTGLREAMRECVRFVFGKDDER